MPIPVAGSIAESLNSLTYPASLIWQKWGISFVIIRADRDVRLAAGKEKSGHSQFAPLKLRSLTVVPSSGAQSAPMNFTYGSFTASLFLPGLRRSRKRLAAVQRPGFAGMSACSTGISNQERPASA